MPREHTAVVKFLSLEKLGSLKLYSLKCLYTKCIPKLFAGNERSEVPEKGGDLRGGSTTNTYNETNRNQPTIVLA